MQRYSLLIQDLPKFHRATESDWAVAELEPDASLLQMVATSPCRCATELVFRVVVNVKDYNHQGKDTVMLVKEWVTSPGLSQRPLVVLPAHYLQRLQLDSLSVLPRSKLPQRSVDELLGLVNNNTVQSEVSSLLTSVLRSIPSHLCPDLGS